MMIRQLAILFGCLALGELIIYLTHIPLPSSILGMLLLTLLLKLKVIRLEWVRSISDFLVGNIGFFFVPPGVAIMLYLTLSRLSCCQSLCQRWCQPFLCWLLRVGSISFTVKQKAN